MFFTLAYSPIRTIGLAIGAMIVISWAPVFAKTPQQPSASQSAAPQSEKESALLTAVTAGDSDGVKEAIASGANVDCRNDDGETALMLACGTERQSDHGTAMVAWQAGNDDIVEQLLRAGANPNLLNPANVHVLSPLERAVSLHEHRIVYQLLAHKGSTHPRPYWHTALWTAAVSHDPLTIRLLLHAGAATNDPKDIGPKGENLLGNAMRDFPLAEKKDVIQCVRLLCEAGADPRRQPGSLVLAYWGEMEELIPFLLGHHASWGEIGPYGATVLFAVDDPAIIAKALAGGCRVNQIDESGRTALFSEHSLAALHALVTAGAKLDIADRYGQTAAGTAAMRGDIDAANYLLKAGAPIAVKTSLDNNGIVEEYFSYLDSYARQHKSIDRGQAIRILRLMSANGVDIKAPFTSRFANGSDALHHAVILDSPKLVRYLLDAGCSPTRKDADGRTAEDVIHSGPCAQALLHDVTNPVPSTGIPLSFWKQFLQLTIGFHTCLLPLDPDPKRQDQLESMVRDLVAAGFGKADLTKDPDSPVDPGDFWQSLKDTQRAALRKKYAPLFAGFSPRRTWLPEPDQAYIPGNVRHAAALGGVTLAEIREFYGGLRGSAGSLTEAPDSAKPRTATASLPFPTHLTDAEIHAVLEKSDLKTAVDLLEEGVATGAPTPDEGTVRDAFLSREKSLGASLLALYRSNKPLLEKSLGKTLLPVDCDFRFAQGGTKAIPAGGGKRAAVLLSPNDILASFYACIDSSFASLLTTDGTPEQLAPAFFREMGQSTGIVLLQSSRIVTNNTDDGNATNPAAPPLPPSLTQGQKLQRLFLAIHTLRDSPSDPLANLEAVDADGQMLGEVMKAIGTYRPQKEQATDVLWPYMVIQQNESRAIEWQWPTFIPGDYEEKAISDAMNTFGTDMTVSGHFRQLELKFDSVLLFVLAHEIGHHALNTAGKSDLTAEQGADAFAATLLTRVYASLAIAKRTELGDPKGGAPATTYYIDRNLLDNYLGYGVYLGNRLLVENTAGVDPPDNGDVVSDHPSPAARVDSIRNVVNRVLPEVTPSLEKRENILISVNGASADYDLASLLRTAFQGGSN